ncbi:MAG: acyltransferase family protein, partial [Methylococcus sp.]|nr:acyltransferase family protein [Methylococcus sp.]
MNPVSAGQDILGYRPDIDGLRALAVLAVVIYHAIPEWLPGGFVGVDVFFVISGYLITSIVSQDIRAGKFSIARFYLRRARRILPALCVVLLATLGIGLVFLLPADLRLLGRHTLYTGIFVSNIAFWNETGYFDEAAELKPLLHTWSLGVEEQFYICWPLLLTLLLKGGRLSKPVIWSVVLASFALACWAALFKPAAGFFLLPMRAWELMAGAVLALEGVPGAERRVIRHLQSLAGLGLIAAGVLSLNARSVFPGWNALLPCLGAVLLIRAGAGAFVNRWLLSLRPVVWIGLVSYSLYLWHWPILSLSRLVLPYRLEPGQLSGLIGLALALSALSYRYVETPFRSGRYRSEVTLGRAGAVTVLIVMTGAVLLIAKGFPGRFAPEVIASIRSAHDVNPHKAACLREEGSVFEGLNSAACTQPGDTAEKILVWGDSHADAWVPGVARLARDSGRGLVQQTMSACPPLADVDFVDSERRILIQPGCKDFNAAVLSAAVNDSDIRTVFLIARWAPYIERTRFGAEDNGPSPPFLIDAAQAECTPENTREVFRRALHNVVDRLTAAGKRVVIVGQLPELGFSVPRCYAKQAVLKTRGLSALAESGNSPACSAPAPVVAARLLMTDDLIREVSRRDSGVCTVFPEQALCTGGYCVPQRDGLTLYVDDDHLSQSG